MTLLGLPTTWFLGLLAASVAVVALLYRLKLRRRTIEVAFARLWRRVVRHRPATSLFERFRQVLSFLLQVAFVFLLLLAIARPRVGTEVGRERRFVIVIDASARMQARLTLDGADDRSRFHEAKDRAMAFVRRLGEGDRASILLAGLTPSPLTVFEGDRGILLDALENASPTDARSDLDRSVRFARSLLGDSAGRVIVFTDRPGEDVPIGVDWVQVGKPFDNVAITRFAASTPFDSPGEVELFYEVRNFGRSEAGIVMRVERFAVAPEGSAAEGVPLPGDGTLIESIPLKLGPGERVSGVLRKLAREDAGLLATLVDAEGKPRRDGLALDDRAFAVVNAARVLRVTVVGPGNVFLEKLLRSDPLITWRRIQIDEFKLDAEADVVIFDRCAPEGGFPRAVYIRPEGTGSPVAVSGEVKDVFIDEVAADHPVMRFVGKLADLNVTRSRALVPAGGDVTLASCAGTPVIIARRTKDAALVALGFDLTDSDLVLRVAFPKLFRNALTWLASGDAQTLDANRLTGDPVEYEPAGPKLWRCDPFTSKDRQIVRQVPPETMRWKVGWYARDRVRFAVNLGDEEVSDLHAVPSVPEGVARDTALARMPVAGDLWPWLVALALALTVFEWLSYHRRWTV